MSSLQQKARDLLRLASLKCTSSEWAEEYDRLCGLYSEKAVSAKMEELARRGYIEYGVSVRTAWLTAKGVEALDDGSV